MSSSLKFYYWGHPIVRNCFNFGDMVTPLLMQYYVSENNIVIADSANDADVFSTGSIIHHIPQNRFAIIIGSGLIKDEKIHIPSAIVYAVRGKLTKEILGISDDIALGDPALLLPLIYKSPNLNRTKKPIGIVPHYIHYTSPLLDNFRHDERYKVINVRAETKYVVDEICSCSAIISSSLHGLIVADAYGIPNRHLEFENHPLMGGHFKFDDYYSSIGRRGLAAQSITPLEIHNNLEFDCEYFTNIPEVQKKLDSAFKKFVVDIPNLIKTKELLHVQKLNYNSEIGKLQESDFCKYEELHHCMKVCETHAQEKFSELNARLQSLIEQLVSLETSRRTEMKQLYEDFYLLTMEKNLWYKCIYHSALSRICWGAARTWHIKKKKQLRQALRIAKAKRHIIENNEQYFH